MVGPTQAELDAAIVALREAIGANILAQAALHQQEQNALEQAVAANREARAALKQQEVALRKSEAIIDRLVAALKDAETSLSDYRKNQ